MRENLDSCVKNEFPRAVKRNMHGGAGVCVENFHTSLRQISGTVLISCMLAWKITEEPLRKFMRDEINDQ